MSVSKSRHSQRTTLKVPAEYGLVKLGGNDPRQSSIESKGLKKSKFRGIVATIGLGGLFLQTRDFFPSGSEIWVKFKIPGGENPVYAVGKVVWVVEKIRKSERYSRQGMGISFNQIDETGFNQIDAFITKKSRIFRELKHLLSQKTPPVKKINDLLTSTYIDDYQSLEELRRKVDNELATFRFSRKN